MTTTSDAPESVDVPEILGWHDGNNEVNWSKCVWLKRQRFFEERWSWSWSCLFIMIFIFSFGSGIADSILWNDVQHLRERPTELLID